MFTVVRGDFIRQSLDIAIRRWWERHELPPLELLRDGLLFLEQGGDLNESQRSILLRTALNRGKGVLTALRHQANPERTSILLNDALLTVGSQWTENDLQQWLLHDPHADRWRDLLRMELMATNQVALPSQRRKIDSLLEAIRDAEVGNGTANIPGRNDEWELIPIIKTNEEVATPPTSTLRYLIATVLFLSLAFYFYNRYGAVWAQSDMIEVTALFQPIPRFEPTSTSTPPPTFTPTPTATVLPTATPTATIEQSSANQPLSPLQAVSPLQVESPLQLVSPLATPVIQDTPVSDEVSDEASDEVINDIVNENVIVGDLLEPTLAEPVRTVEVVDTQPSIRTVSIDRSEVTNAEYRKCMAANRCPSPASNDSETRSNYLFSPEFDDFPVVNVDWAAAFAFCDFRGKRLPAADEWEAAASLAPATDRRYRYPWGDQFVAKFANGFDARFGDTTRVGFYRPNGNSPLGANDMAGNVAEWTATLVQNDGTQQAVVKGGSYLDKADMLLADSFQLVEIHIAKPWLGFRCAR